MKDDPTICVKCQYCFQYWFHGEDNLYCWHDELKVVAEKRHWWQR